MPRRGRSGAQCTNGVGSALDAGHEVACTDDTEYEVECILDEEVGPNGERRFLVKWANWPEADATWEGEEALNECTGVLRRWRREYQRRESRASAAATEVPASPAEPHCASAQGAKCSRDSRAGSSAAGAGRPGRLAAQQSAARTGQLAAAGLLGGPELAPGAGSEAPRAEEAAARAESAPEAASDAVVSRVIGATVAGDSGGDDAPDGTMESPRRTRTRSGSRLPQAPPEHARWSTNHSSLVVTADGHTARCLTNRRNPAIGENVFARGRHVITFFIGESRGGAGACMILGVAVAGRRAEPRSAAPAAAPAAALTSAEAVAWGFNPFSGRVFATSSVGCWGHARRVLLEGGMHGMSTGARVRAHIDIEGRTLAFSVNDGPPLDARVKLPTGAALRPWVLLSLGGDEVTLLDVADLDKPRSEPAAEDTAAEAPAEVEVKAEKGDGRAARGGTRARDRGGEQGSERVLRAAAGPEAPTPLNKKRKMAMTLSGRRLGMGRPREPHAQP